MNKLKQVAVISRDREEFYEFFKAQGIKSPIQNEARSILLADTEYIPIYRVDQLCSMRFDEYIETFDALYNNEYSKIKGYVNSNPRK